MSNYYKISFIGAGNVAWHLAEAFENAGHIINEIYSRDPDNARKLADRLYEAEFQTDLDFSESDSEIFIMAVHDDAISAVMKALVLPPVAILVHTSGSQPLTVLSAANYTGVFYPLQTFSKHREVKLKQVPICIESADKQVLGTLRKLAKSISKDVRQVSSADRAVIHLAAVFSCNFTNHMLRIAEDIVTQAHIPFEMLHPLIVETINKALETGPRNAQTGPAVRGDTYTMDRHIQALGSQEGYIRIYKEISQHIMDSRNTED